MRRVFKSIPRAYTAAVLDVIGMPDHRMIFLDTWYVPIEQHLSQIELELEFERHQVNYMKLTSEVEFDLDAAIARGISAHDRMGRRGASLSAPEAPDGELRRFGPFPGCPLPGRRAARRSAA